MSRYIDADKLMEQVTKKKPLVAQARYTEGFNDAILKVRSMIHSAVTADVVEVRHRHWIKEFAWSYGYTDHHKLTCSECGLTFTEDARSVDEYKYCYGCGAKMDGERRKDGKAKTI